MSVWVPILLLLIRAAVLWFCAHCTAYLSDIRELLENIAKADDETPNRINQ